MSTTLIENFLDNPGETLGVQLFDERQLTLVRRVRNLHDCQIW